MSKMHDSELLARRALQVQRGGARAAVLGVNDGLVSVLCIVLGVAGAGATTHNVVIAGLAGLLAGAVSMAAGEWISVKAQVELFSGIMTDVKKLIQKDRSLLVGQLRDSLSEDGYKHATALTATNEVARDDDQLTEVYARQVMGFNPDELGSPWVAAISSFSLFTIGALVPLLAWFLVERTTAIWVSIILTSIGGLIVGGYIGWTSGKSVVYGSLRQLGIIVLSAAVTYGIGYLLGVSVA
jgi:VIT1/CCC1 family predicted Fe2+/Mn2+ transporter